MKKIALKREDLIVEDGKLYLPWGEGLLISDDAKNFTEAEVFGTEHWAATNFDNKFVNEKVHVAFKDSLVSYELFACGYAGKALIGKDAHDSNLLVIDAVSGVALKEIPDTENLRPTRFYKNNVAQVEGPKGFGVVNIDSATLVVNAEFKEVHLYDDGRIEASHGEHTVEKQTFEC